jgi:hypothetical protein
VINVADVVESGLVSAEVHTEGSKREKDQVEEQLVMDVSASAAIPDAENPQAKMASIRETGAGDIAITPRHSEGIGHNAVCGLLLERLQDVSVCFVCLTNSFVCN